MAKLLATTVWTIHPTKAGVDATFVSPVRGNQHRSSSDSSVSELIAAGSSATASSRQAKQSRKRPRDMLDPENLESLLDATDGESMLFSGHIDEDLLLNSLPVAGGLSTPPTRRALRGTPLPQVSTSWALGIEPQLLIKCFCWELASLLQDRWMGTRHKAPSGTFMRDYLSVDSIRDEVMRIITEVADVALFKREYVEKERMTPSELAAIDGAFTDRLLTPLFHTAKDLKIKFPPRKHESTAVFGFIHKWWRDKALIFCERYLSTFKKQEVCDILQIPYANPRQPHILQLKVLVHRLGTKKLWRRLQVPSEASVSDLVIWVVQAFGWYLQPNHAPHYVLRVAPPGCSPSEVKLFVGVLNSSAAVWDSLWQTSCGSMSGRLADEELAAVFNIETPLNFDGLAEIVGPAVAKTLQANPAPAFAADRFTIEHIFPLSNLQGGASTSSTATGALTLTVEGLPESHSFELETVTPRAIGLRLPAVLAGARSPSQSNGWDSPGTEVFVKKACNAALNHAVFDTAA